MDDKLKGLDLELEDDDYTPVRKTKKSGGGKGIFITIIVVLFLALCVLGYFLLFDKSNYDSGLEYLADKKYEQALIEFQQIPPTSDKYIFAQSKVNYINGLKLFNEKQYEQSKIFLDKVELNDEYFNEVKFMLKKIEDDEKSRLLESQLREDEKQKILEAQLETEQKIKDQETGKKYFKELLRVEDKFENEYQLAKLESSNSMKTNLRNLNNIRQQMLDIEYEAVEPDAALADFKSALSQWMNSRVKLVQKVISEDVDNMEDASTEVKLLITDSDKLREEVIISKDRLKSGYGVK